MPKFQPILWAFICFIGCILYLADAFGMIKDGEDE